MTDHFTKLFTILLPHEQKKCTGFFAKHDGEKEKAMFAEMRKLKDKTSEELAVKIYGDKQKATNIRQLRKQVTDKLVGFVRENFVSENNGSTSIRRLLDFSDFLISRHAPALALEYLLEAENEAKQNKYYELLENIYHYKLYHSVALGLDAKLVYEEWQLNHKRYLSYMHLLAAQSSLIQLLDDHRRKGVLPQQDELLKEFYERFTPDAEEKRNPDFMIGVAKIFRHVMLSTKDYWRIETAVKDIYDELIAQQCFTSQHDEVRRNFLLILAQACYRNLKFDEAELYLKEVQMLLPSPTPRNDPHYAKLQSMRAAIYTYTDRCAQAIELLRKQLYGPEPIENEVERNNMQLNLAVNYFCVKDYHRALEQLNKLEKSDEEYHKMMGLEWSYKKQMIAMILCHCANKFEEAENRLENMLFYFDTFLDQELYARAKVFMQFVQRWFRDPDLITNPRFHQEIKDSQMGWGNKEDIQAIFFFSWFRAHMLGQDFYATFQARIKQEGQNWDYPFSLP